METESAPTVNSDNICQTSQLLQIGLLPGQSIGMGDAGMGCFKAGTGLTRVCASHKIVVIEG